MMNQETIHIRKLTTGYPGKGGTKIVAKDIDATIRRGELTCLLGANGVGKSTLLRTLSAFQPPVGGEIEIMGKKLTDYTDKQLATVIGVVLTEKCSLRNMTVEELVGMGRSPYTGFWGNLSKEDKNTVNDAIALVRIEDLKYRMVHTLSDGERQKVMIAKALAQETPVIFLSTHDLELALQIADKIWLMDKANGVTIGTPEDLSIDGCLSNFFSRKGIVFDMETGLFRIDNEFEKEVRLVGHGNKYAMVRKALQRNGILASRRVESDFYIETGDMTTSGYIIHPVAGRTIKVDTIEELLEQVTAILASV